MFIRLLVSAMLFFAADAASADPCTSETTPPGTVCAGGSLYAGNISSQRYMVTPGNCTDSKTPVCNGDLDKVTKQWGADGVVTGVKSPDDGLTNTQTLVQKYRDTAAARYCQDLEFGGYTDWFLPAENEMLLLKKNKREVGSFNDDIGWYWTSTETTWTSDPRYEKGLARVVGTGYTNASNYYKKDSYLVRCIRRF